VSRSAHLGGWDEERKDRIAPLWQQIKATQYRPGNIQIEGKARELYPVRREGRLNIGDRVMHTSFGIGTIRKIDHDKLEILFDKGGIKKVMESFVKPV
jgi:DNA helicase-2/ATP-dependent DNA helicase PcrA